MSLLTSLILPGVASIITIIYLGFTIYFFDKVRNGNVGVVTPSEASAMMWFGIILLIVMVIYTIWLFFSYFTRRPKSDYAQLNENNVTLVKKDGKETKVEKVEKKVKLEQKGDTVEMTSYA